MTRAQLSGLATLALSLAACTEPSKLQQAPAPAAPMAARLELSDSSAAPGTAVTVTVRITGAGIASATGRVIYDSTGLAFESEEPIADGATRVINPVTGALRFAVVAPDSLAAGRVNSLRFIVRRTDALRTIAVAFDEAHTTTRADATARLKVAAP